MLIFIRVVEKFHSSINKIALIDRFHEIETNGELIFQLFYYIIPSNSSVKYSKPRNVGTHTETLMLKICKRSIFGITRKGSDARELKQYQLTNVSYLQKSFLKRQDCLPKDLATNLFSTLETKSNQ